MGHHYVPQRYLRNFQDTTDMGKIWLHDKERLSPRSASIKWVAHSKGYYSEETERRLATEVEGPGSDAIEKIIAGASLDDVERLRVALYIGTMMKRVPRNRRKGKELFPVVLDDVVERCKADFEAFAAEMLVDPELVAMRLAQLDKLREQYEVAPPQEVLDQVNEPWPTINVLSAIYNMTWRVVESPGPQFFITSDNPMFFFEGLGVGDPQAEITFPLASSHALIGSWQGRPGTIIRATVPLKWIREINRRVASTTERFGFYHRQAPWLLEILAKEKPQLTRFGW